MQFKRADVRDEAQAVRAMVAERDAQRERAIKDACIRNLRLLVNQADTDERYLQQRPSVSNDYKRRELKAIRQRRSRFNALLKRYESGKPATATQRSWIASDKYSYWSINPESSKWYDYSKDPDLTPLVSVERYLVRAPKGPRLDVPLSMWNGLMGVRTALQKQINKESKKEKGGF